MKNWKKTEQEDVIENLESTVDLNLMESNEEYSIKLNSEDQSSDGDPLDSSKEESSSDSSAEEDHSDDVKSDVSVDPSIKEESSIAKTIKMTPGESKKLANQTQTIQITQSDLRNDIPSFRSGDKISVGYRVIEGSRSRVQNFEGVVIKISSGHGLDKTFTVRKISGGIGVERIFPFHSPNIESLKILKEGKVRRAKLYYLRSRKGKATRIKERI